MADWVHTHTQVVVGSIARVFEALTSPDQLRGWFAEYVDLEPHPGGAFRFWGRRTYGTPTEAAAQQRFTWFEPGRGVAFTWRFDGADTEVRVTLDAALDEADGERTRVEVQHVFPTPLWRPCAGVG